MPPEKEKPTHQKDTDKIALVGVALRICGVNSDEKVVDLICRIINLIDQKKGETTLSQIQEIDNLIRSEYKKRE